MNYVERISNVARSYRRKYTKARDIEAGRVLGWISLALGAAELAMPGQLDRLLGTGKGENRRIFQTLGVREVMQGVDILTHNDPTPGIWARVAGDMLDSALLAVAATKTKRPFGLLTAFTLVLPVVIADIVYAKRLSE